MSLINIIGTWLAAGLTIAIFSFLYKDNPLYKFAEHIYVGASAAFWVVIFWYSDVNPMLIERLFDPKFPIVEKLILAIPTTFGIMMLCRWFPKIAWLSRWPIAFTVGMAAGLALTATVQGYIVPQIRATLFPAIVITKDPLLSLWRSFMHIFVIFGVFTTILYFYFSREHTGLLKVGSRIGIIFIMVGFGASFGYTIMARISLLIGRIYFLLHSWLGMID